MASQVAPDKISEIAPLTAQARRALLIGSSYGNLLGTENDVNIIERLLRSYEFDDIKKLCGEDATRQKILDEWESLTARSSPGDAVVIYYSGHGSLSDSKNAEGEQEQRWRIQFIIPIDFDPTLTSWQGISDGELSQLLLQTTNRTRNVTCILDCCHSSRAIRDLRAQTPSNVDARVKLLPLAQKDHNQIVNLLGTPGLAGVLDDNYIWTNPHAVRIAAAAVDEGAWECSDGTSVSGILTKTLAEVMDKAGKTTMSWWNIMLGVRELVGRKFVQHPRSEGPDFRVPFSVGNGNANALLAEIEESGSAIVRGGKVDGVRVGDVYNITQLGSQGGIATATVTKVYIFTAEATLTPEIPHNGHPLGLVFAVPHRRSRWPAEFPDLQGIQARLDESKYLERCESGARPLITLQWKHDNDNNESVVLRTDRGVQLWEGRADNGMISPQAIEKLFSVAEKFAQAQHILNLEPDSDESSLKAAMKVGLSRVEPTGENFLWQYDTT
jgi:hypothetical protein